MSIALKNWGISIPSPYVAPECRGFTLYGYPEDHPVEKFSDPTRQIVTSLVRDPGPGRVFQTQNSTYELVGPPSLEWLAALAAKGYRAEKFDPDNPFQILKYEQPILARIKEA